jgi:hypothetical protein
MGLALLDLDDADGSRLQFSVDTGTNPWYRLRFGRKAGQRDGFDEIDDIVHATPLARNPKAGWTFDTRILVRLPAGQLRDARYAQLLSYKDERGRSPAISSALRLAVGGGLPYVDDGLLALSLESAMTSAPTFQAPRTVSCRTTAEAFSLPPMVGNILGELVKLAGPIVTRLLGSAGSAAVAGSAAGAPTAGGAANGQAAAATPPANLIADLLRAVLSAVTSPAPVPTSGPQSLVDPQGCRPTRNRFAGPVLSRQQVFGIDDALLATIIGPMIGPIIQVLPQLLNAAADEKLKLRQENNKLITTLMAGLDQRRMMELLAQARAASPGNPALAALNGMFEGEHAAPAAATATATAAPAVMQSLASAPAPPKALSSKAALSFLLAPPMRWYGDPCHLFVKAAGLRFRLKLDVGANGPTKPLPKAIAHLCVKNASEQVLHQQEFRLLDVAPGTPIALALEPGDVSHLPVNTKLSVTVQLRWPGSRAAAYQAATMAEVVLVDKYFVTAFAGPVAGDRELVDMQTYRPFWNKVWESPTLQSTGDGDGSSHWNLDAALRYSVIFAPAQAANGLMETRRLTAAADPQSPIARTEGRFKGGIELSVAEVNKLMPLWSGEQPLSPEVLGAFATDEFARRTSGEVIHSLRLKGSKRERGLVWVVPVFTLNNYTVGVVEASDESGQVTKATEQPARFPVPTAVRVLTMKSEG